MTDQSTHYAKGDEFWWVYVDTIHNGGVYPPRVLHGVVTGGGDIMVRYLVDGDRGNSAERRSVLEARVSRTREQAIERAIEEYRAIRDQATKTIAEATDAIARLLEEK